MSPNSWTVVFTTPGTPISPEGDLYKRKELFLQEEEYLSTSWSSHHKSQCRSILWTGLSHTKFLRPWSKTEVGQRPSVTFFLYFHSNVFVLQSLPLAWEKKDGKLTGVKREFLSKSESNYSETPILGLLAPGSCPRPHWLSKERGEPSFPAWVGFGSPLTVSAFGAERAWRRQTRGEEPVRKRCPGRASLLNISAALSAFSVPWHMHTLTQILQHTKKYNIFCWSDKK